MENLDVMISYSHADGSEIAQKVIDTLSTEGVNCWWDKHILPGSDWDESIATAIAKCKVLVLVLTDESNKSDQVKKELNLLATYNVAGVLVPFKVTRDLPSMKLAHALIGKQWIDVPDPQNDGHYHNVKKQVLSLLGRNSGTKADIEQRLPLASIVTPCASTKPAWNLDTPFSSLIETHFANYPELIPIAKHVTSGWNHGVESQSRTGTYLEIYTGAGISCDYADEDKELVWNALAIGPDGKSLVLLATSGFNFCSYDNLDKPLEGDDSAKSYYQLLGWKWEFVANPSILNSQGTTLVLDGMIGLSIPMEDVERIWLGRNILALCAWESRWLDKQDYEEDENNPLDSCRKELMSAVDAFLRRSPALWEVFAVYYHEICKGEKAFNAKFSKNNDRFLSLDGIHPRMDMYVDQVEHMSYLIIRKTLGTFDTPSSSDTKNIKTYFASVGWKWEILDQVSTRERGEKEEVRLETDLVALPFKLYDVDYEAKVEALKRILREYGADMKE